MISIRRAACPNVLRGSPPEGDVYSDNELVQALWDMQHQKCCYCEQKIPEKGHGQNVEHFRPKARPEFARLRNAWRNLLLACPTCNGQKSDEFPTDSKGRPLLIDPSSAIDPERHISFVVDDGPDEPIGLPCGSTRRGKVAIETTGLYFPYYVRIRHEYYRTVIGPRLAKVFEAKGTGNAKDWADAKAGFEELCASSSRFAGFVRCLARRRRLHEIGIDIPGGS